MTGVSGSLDLSRLSVVYLSLKPADHADYGNSAVYMRRVCCFEHRHDRDPTQRRDNKLP